MVDCGFICIAVAENDVDSYCIMIMGAGITRIDS